MFENDCKASNYFTNFSRLYLISWSLSITIFFWIINMVHYISFPCMFFYTLWENAFYLSICRCFSLVLGYFEQFLDNNHCDSQGTPLISRLLGASETPNIWSKFEANRRFGCWFIAIYFTKEYSQTKMLKGFEATKPKTQFLRVWIVQYQWNYFSKTNAAVGRKWNFTILTWCQSSKTPL